MTDGEKYQWLLSNAWISAGESGAIAGQPVNEYRITLRVNQGFRIAQFNSIGDLIEYAAAPTPNTYPNPILNTPP